MTVARILGEKSGDVVTITPERSLADAAQRLADHRIGALVVVDAGRHVVGILSERDIVRAIARVGPNALAETVAGHMTSKVVTAIRSDRIVEIMERMTAGRFRHVPVVEDSRLVGIISIGDVVKQRLAEIEREADAMRQYILA